MKSATERKIKILIFCLFFGFCVFAVGYFYLNSLLNTTLVSQKSEKVPYYSTPENTTVLLEICNDKLLLNLDFKGTMLSVIFLNEDVDTNSDVYGYDVQYYLKSNYELVAYLADYVGGVELEDNQESLRFTGVQIRDMLEYSNVSSTNKRIITENIINGISKKGLSKDDLLFLIENSETNLGFADAYIWLEYIKTLCCFPRFVN